MCGIVGVWHLAPNRPVVPALIHTLTTTLRHRGPDDEGYLLVNTLSRRVATRGGQETMPQLALPNLYHPDSPEGYNLAIGFRRLAILDPSPAGHQPMSSADGALWLVYNGEIYNHRELRAELHTYGYTFRTGTDTEVILCAYDAWGEACLERFNGMWALALWDNRQQRLFCARDRFGMKPLYYFWDASTFAFASEIKVLRQLPGLVRQPNDGLIYDYLRYGRSAHSEETSLANIRQLLPAHYLVLHGNAQLRKQCYWTLHRPRCHEPVGGEADTIERFYALFEDAVRLHLRSDVPVGMCLSGGLDSSAIVCVANRLLLAEPSVSASALGKRLKTFSSCYDDARFDERSYIEAVVAQTGAEAHYTCPSPQKLLQVVEKLVWHQDEPFGGLSVFAQWCVMELAAAHGVRVMLDGQGGDELLAGYHASFDYFWGGLLWQGRWRALGHEWQAYQRYYGALLPHLVLRTLRPFAPASLQGVMRRWQRRGDLGIAADFARAYRHRAHEFIHRSADPLDDYLADLLRYSIPMLLHFEDRNSMAHSIEARVPFLDYRLVEYAFSLPAALKISQGITKHVLRSALRDILPETVRRRTDKMGFVVPERLWLADALDTWIRDIVASQTFRTRPYFNVKRITTALDGHKRGQRDLSKLAWRWINLELWLRQMVD
jgi:asparagine synthase (glutamine-hydrolysing)